MGALANISSDFIPEYDIVWEVAGYRVWLVSEASDGCLPCDKNSQCVWAALLLLDTACGTPCYSTYICKEQEHPLIPIVDHNHGPLEEIEGLSHKGKGMVMWAVRQGGGQQRSGKCWNVEG